MKNINTDILLEIIKRSSIQEIKTLCQSSSKIYNLCKQHKNLIYNAKCKNLKIFIRDNDKDIQIFCKNNNYQGDGQGTLNAERVNGQGTLNAERVPRGKGKFTLYDKIWIDLMFLLSKKFYDEADVLLTCTKLPEPPLGLFFEKYMVNMPEHLMKLLMQNFPNILDVFGGYDTKEDFLSDFPIYNFKNKTLKNIILNLS